MSFFSFVQYGSLTLRLQGTRNSLSKTS